MQRRTFLRLLSLLFVCSITLSAFQPAITFAQAEGGIGGTGTGGTGTGAGGVSTGSQESGSSDDQGAVQSDTAPNAPLGVVTQEALPDITPAPAPEIAPEAAPAPAPAPAPTPTPAQTQATAGFTSAWGALVNATINNAPNSGLTPAQAGLAAAAVEASGKVGQANAAASAQGSATVGSGMQSPSGSVSTGLGAGTGATRGGGAGASTGGTQKSSFLAASILAFASNSSDSATIPTYSITAFGCVIPTGNSSCDATLDWSSSAGQGTVDIFLTPPTGREYSWSALNAAWTNGAPATLRTPVTYFTVPGTWIVKMKDHATGKLLTLTSLEVLRAESASIARKTGVISATGCTIPAGGISCDSTLDWSTTGTAAGTVDIALIPPRGVEYNWSRLNTSWQNGAPGTLRTQATYFTVPGTWIVKVYEHGTKNLLTLTSIDVRGAAGAPLTLSASACKVGQPSTLVPGNSFVCDSKVSWAASAYDTAYVVVTGNFPYNTARFPYGYVAGSGLSVANAKFWTVAGNYKASLYLNGVPPTLTTPGTGVRFKEVNFSVVAGGTTATPIPANYCPALTQNLTIGSNNAQVIELQKFLSSYYRVNQGDIVTGNFGPLTKSYVARFQREGSPTSTGTVGPITRARIAVACRGTTVTPVVPPTPCGNGVGCTPPISQNPTPTAPTTNHPTSITEYMQYMAQQAHVSGTLSATACTMGTGSTFVPGNNTICDSTASWGTFAATSSYVVISGDYPYNSNGAYPYGFVLPPGLSGSNVKFWTPAGTYKAALYVNGVWPSTTAAGTGNKIQETSITVRTADASANAPAPVMEALLRDTSDSSCTTNRLAGASLLPGQSIASCNGRYHFTFGTDGNLTLTGAVATLWSSNTAGSGGAKLTMQTDGNLVLYSASRQALWATNKMGAEQYLQLKNDGTLAVYSSNGTLRWNTSMPTSQAAPTATLTVNGGSSATVGVGSTFNLAWSSTNAVSANSTYTTDSPACGMTGAGPYPFATVPTLSGVITSGAITSCQAGHTYTITLTVTSASGQTASASVQVRVNTNTTSTRTVGSGQVATAALALQRTARAPQLPVAVQTTYASAPITHTLAVGWTGPEVTALQTLLIKLGFLQEEATGYFGEVTKQAVMAYQQAHNLPAVGIVGPQTRQMLAQ